MLRWNDFWARTEDYRSFVRDQWGLDTWIAWPFIEASLTDREREIHNDASANVHFFQNASLGALAVAVGLVVAAIDDPVLGGWVGSALVAVGCGALAYWFYRGAVAAVELWGQAKIVSVITHRYELYAHLGYREPTSPAEEREIGRGANEILYGENKKGPEEHVRLDRTPRSTPGAPFGSH